jgi:serine/threonine protein kinase/tetratricopeptide (TPR) repeat protein
MINCGVSDEQLWSWVDQNSPELERHISNCPRCWKVAQTLRAHIGALRAQPAATQQPLPDHIGSYRILGLLGEGGQGLVYSAEQPTPRRAVALKVLKGGRFVHEHEVRYFEREAQTLGALHHPGIATIYEAGRTEEGLHFFAMELVRGAPLTTYIRATDPLLRDRLELFCKICDAVEYAHCQGVVHRDLKPGNILVDADGNPHILDFGLARLTEADLLLSTRITQSGQIVGTLRYMSPEQARGSPEAIDVRSDVYSLGVMLFELLADKPPYEIGSCPAEALTTICEATPRRLGATDRTLRGDLETIVCKALEKEPARRYQSVAALCRDIRRYLGAEPILARPPSGLYLLRKKLSKHRWRVGLTAAALALGVFGLWGGLSLSRHAIRQQQLRDQAASEAQRAQELDQGRREALMIQRKLEANQPEQRARWLAKAEQLASQYPDLPEANLVWVQARFRDAQQTGGQMRMDQTLRLAEQNVGGPSAGAFCALLADMHRALGHGQEACQWQAQADRAAATMAEDWYLRSFATLDVAAAQRWAQGAIDRDPQNVWALERLAYLCVQAGEFERALTCAQTIERLGRNPETWQYFEGSVLLRQGRYQDAVDHFTRLIAAAPQVAELHQRRAIARLCLRDYEGALADFDRGIQLGQRHWPNRQRATVLWILGDLAEAAAGYRQFRQSMGDDYANVRLFLVECDQARQFRRQGREDEAARLLAQASAEFQAARLKCTDAWLECISLCVAGAISPTELLARATPLDDEKRCEAYYYGGERYLLDNDVEQARAFFRHCVDLHLPLDSDEFPPDPMNEFHLAVWRLDSLEANRPDLPVTAGMLNADGSAVPTTSSP